MPNLPKNKSLYEKVKKEAKEKFKVWPSAYASGWLVKEYKRRGGLFQGDASEKPLARWYQEKWIDVCELPNIVPCGRSKASWKDYPYCRPLKKVSKKTPKTAEELTTQEIQKRCEKKKKNPKTRILPAKF